MVSRPPQPLITLTTDFGVQDEYVGVMKGVMLTIEPRAQFVDLSHSIAPQNLHQAAYLLGHAYSYFPPGTIHLVVVDPGVGTDRCTIVVQADNHIFVAPDNGVLSMLLEKSRFETASQVIDSDLFLPRISTTFHGRDIFAPIAAHLAGGLSLAELGPQLARKDCIRLDLPAAVVSQDRVTGEVIHVDRFGNLRTNIPGSAVTGCTHNKNCTLHIGPHTLTQFCSTYGHATKGQCIGVIDSWGMLEIAVAGGNAARQLAMKRGERVVVLFGEEQ